MDGGVMVKPCPFCGRRHVMRLTEPFDSGFCGWVHCPRCGARGPEEWRQGEEDARAAGEAAWHRRAKP